MKINARAKGHTYEREIAKWWRDRGFENCKTSRYESKMLDDLKVDLTNTNPFNCQLKAVENLGSIHKVLDSMPKDSNYNLVFHKKTRQGTIVAMSLDSFKELVDMLKLNKII